MKRDDLFPDEFANKRTTVKKDVVVNSKGDVESVKLPNVNSLGRQISATKQGLENFWKWFGNSEAVDQKGRPLVFFHGTNSDFNEFKTKIKTYNNYGLLGNIETVRSAIFVTPDLEFSHGYTRTDDLNKLPGANIISVYAKSENPFDLRKGLTNKQWDELESVGYSPKFIHQAMNVWEIFDDEEGEHLVSSLKRLGYDGAIIEEEGNSGYVEVWVLFDSSQLKSSIGNKGTWNSNSKNITEGKQMNKITIIEDEFSLIDLKEWCELQSLAGKQVEYSIQKNLARVSLVEASGKKGKAIVSLTDGGDQTPDEEKKNIKVVATVDSDGPKEVTVDVIGSHYIYAHGKKPSGNGKWAFGIGSRDQKDMVVFDGAYSKVQKDAITVAKKKALKLGKDGIKMYVMESCPYEVSYNIDIIKESSLKNTGTLIVEGQKVSTIESITQSAVESKLMSQAESLIESVLKERSLSKKEEKKKESVVKGIKKNAQDMKKRYGKDWESVAYGAATNIAKKKGKSLKESVTDVNDVEGFHRSIMDKIRNRGAEQTANTAIANAQGKFAWKVGTIVYSKKTGKTYKITGARVQNGRPVYHYEANDGSEKGTFDGERAEQNLTVLHKEAIGDDLKPFKLYFHEKDEPKNIRSVSVEASSKQEAMDYVYFKFGVVKIIRVEELKEAEENCEKLTEEILNQIREAADTFEITYSVEGPDGKTEGTTKYKGTDANEARNRFVKDNTANGKRVTVKNVKQVVSEGFGDRPVDVHDLTKEIMRNAVKFAKERIEKEGGEDVDMSTAIEDGVGDYIELLIHHLNDNRAELTSPKALEDYLNEDYEPGQYGSTKDEVIKTIADKYLGGLTDENETALSDAFEAGKQGLEAPEEEDYKYLKKDSKKDEPEKPLKESSVSIYASFLKRV